MNFLSPAFLMALPLVGVPILIHFFSRRQRDPIRWGAMEFLLASATPRRRFLRLRDLLLLLLRIAMVLALIGALAQPMLSSNLIGSTGPRDVILIVDNSMSTARRVGGESVFDLELSEAGKILDQLKANDSVRIVLASPAPAWLNDSPVVGGSGALHELNAHLHEVKPNDGSAGMLECFQTALQAEPASKNAARLITALTDGQAHGWRAETPGAWSSIQALAKKSAMPVAMRVIIPEGVSGSAANLTVERVTASRPVVGVGQPVTLTASVKNNGAQSSPATSLSWSTKEDSLGLSAIPTLAPGASTTVTLSQPFMAAGLCGIECRLASQDDLEPDNSADFLLEVTREIPILIIEGEPESDPAQSDTRYFMAALGYDNECKLSTTAPSLFQPKLINYEQLPKEDLSAYQAVVLADVPRVSADSARKLQRFVDSGGGLWIALGEQTDVTAFNEAFYEKNSALSALPLRQPVGDADNHEKFVAVVPPDASHPATALLADTHRLDIDRVRIYRRHQFDSDNNSSATVLLRAEGGAPVAVEKDSGRGRVIVMAIPLGLAWSSLPLSHSYVVMAREWLWYLTEPGLTRRNLRAGEMLQAIAPLETSSGNASLQTPNGRVLQLFGQEEEGRMVYRFAKTQYPGEYRLTISDSTKGSRIEQFLVGRDPEESDLTPLNAGQMAALGQAGDLQFGGHPLFQPPGQKIAAPPKALAMWLLSILIILMLVELAVSSWLACARRGVSAPVSMEPVIRA
jgi:hypothetical protein